MRVSHPMPRHGLVFRERAQVDAPQVSPENRADPPNQTPRSKRTKAGPTGPERGKFMPENEQDAPNIPKYPRGLRARGKRLWRELHGSADFNGCPETRLVAEEACYLTDEIARQRRIVRAAGAETRVVGYNGQQVSMPEGSAARSGDI